MLRSSTRGACRPARRLRRVVLATMRLVNPRRPSFGIYRRRWKCAPCRRRCHRPRGCSCAYLHSGTAMPRCSASPTSFTATRDARGSRSQGRWRARRGAIATGRWVQREWPDGRCLRDPAVITMWADGLPYLSPTAQTRRGPWRNCVLVLLEQCVQHRRHAACPGGRGHAQSAVVDPALACSSRRCPPQDSSRRRRAVARAHRRTGHPRGSSSTVSSLQAGHRGGAPWPPGQSRRCQRAVTMMGVSAQRLGSARRHPRERRRRARLRRTRRGEPRPCRVAAHVEHRARAHPRRAGGGVAAAYGRLTGRPGVCLSSWAPGR
jgi:hypothetical protein